MAKRDRDTAIWKDTFYRGLPPLYKCLWDYINDDCDNCGVWIVDLKVATICIGRKFDPAQALELFGPRVEPFENGTKWYIKTFIREKLGFTELSPAHKFQKSIIDLLNKHKRDFFKGYPDCLQTVKDMGKGKDMGKDKEENGVQTKIFDVNWATAFDEIWLEQSCSMKFPGLDITEELSHFRNKCDSAPGEYHSRDREGLRLGFLKQLRHAKPANGKPTRTPSFNLKEV